MQYRLIIFDFDGTLADSAACFVRAFNAVAPSLGVRCMPAHQLDELRGLGVAELMRRLDIPMWKVPRLTLEVRRRMAQDLDAVQLFDGMAQTLQALATRGLVLAVVSSNARGSVERVLGASSRRLFSHLGCGASLFGKRRTLRAVAARAGVPPEQVLYVGDETRDAEAAQAAGMHFLGVAWGYTRPDVLQAQVSEPLLRTPEALLSAV